MLNQDNAAARGIRTFLQALIGFVVGLFLAVWAVPGVPDAVTNYVTGNIGGLFALVGIPAALAGLVGYIWNRARGIQ